jgi:hypothetical protein
MGVQGFEISAFFPVDRGIPFCGDRRVLLPGQQSSGLGCWLRSTD